MPHKSLNSVRQILKKLISDRRGQDLIEYALLSGFLVIAIWALFPTGIVPSIAQVFNRLIELGSILVP